MKKIILTITAILIAATLIHNIKAQSAATQKDSMFTEMSQNNLVSTDPVVLITTSMGNIKVRLYNDTPLHRDNFLKLASEGYYDGVLFHRVIKDFMIQTGDPNSKNATPDTQLGAGDPSYTIEAEINYPKHFHKYGALAAARTGDQINPERRSSGSQFYIVTGNKYSTAQLQQMAQRMTMQAMQSHFQKLSRLNQDSIQALYKAQDTTALEALRQKLIKQTEAEVKPITFPAEIENAYTSIGGTPHLDGAYTVFGEVIEGMNVVDSIQNKATGKNDRPIEDIKIISVKVLKN